MARSEFLKQCREKADNKPLHDDVCLTNKGGDCNCPAVVFEKTVYNSPAYQKLLGHAERLEQDRIPEELFDAYAVYENLPLLIKNRLPPVCVSDVLDSIVKLIRERISK